jgi:membrane-associated phospholipid phosphatase
VEKPLQWANITSDLFSPPIVWSIVAFPIGFYNAPSQPAALTWIGIYIFLVCFLPSIYIFWNLKRGNISDLHMHEREERIRPIVFSLVTAAATLIVMLAIGASPIMRMFAVATLVQVGVMLVITAVWQISIHMISMSGVTVTMGLMFGLVPVMIMLPLMLLVAMARLKLERHTPAEIIAGTIVGGVSVFLILSIMSSLEPGLLARI